MATSAQIARVERLVRESMAQVDALSNEALHAVLPALREARDELRSDLYRWLANVDNGQDRFTAFQRTQALRGLDAAFVRIGALDPAMQRALAVGRRDVGALSVENLGNEITRLGSIFGDALTIPQIDTAAVIAQGNKLLWKRHTNSAKRYAGAVGDDIKHLFAVGLAKGETFEQLVTRLRRLGGAHRYSTTIDPGTHAAEIAEGLFARHRHMADRLVRTEVMHGYNVQHDLAIEHANRNRIEGDEEYVRRWDASADPRLCPRCKALHRTTAPIDGTFAGGIKSPPAHPCCRCVALAWLPRWGDMKGEHLSRDDEGKTIEHKPTPLPAPAPRPVQLASRAVPRGSAPRTGPDASVESRADYAMQNIAGLAHTHPGMFDSAIAESRALLESKSFVDSGIAEQLEARSKSLIAEARRASKGAKSQPRTAAAPASLPPASKPATVAPVKKAAPPPTPAPAAPVALVPHRDLPHRVTFKAGRTDITAMKTYEDKWKVYGGGAKNPEFKTRAEAVAEAERRTRAKLVENEKSAADKATKKAQLAAAAPSTDPRAIPPGASIGRLRRAGLIEREGGAGRFVLNERGVRHFAELLAKKQKREAGIGVGHCQICERECAIVAKKISLHGYERPGWGFVVGSCRGSQRLPWELSCDVLPGWITEMQGMLARVLEQLAELDTRTRFSIEVPMREGDPMRPQAGTYVDNTGVVRWTPGSGNKGQLYVPQGIGPEHEKFASARESERIQLQGRADRLEREIPRQQRRLGSWKPEPGYKLTAG